MSNTGFGSGMNTTGNSGNVTTGPGTSGTGAPSGTDFATQGGFGAQSATDAGVCPHCGQSIGRSGLEQFLGRLGITDEMINNLRGQFSNVDLDEYLTTARTYLKDGGAKAGTYAKENPGKVAAGVAALALGAGLIYAAVNREK